MGDTKYYAFVMTMAEHMPQATDPQRQLRAKALGRLVEAVEAAAAARVACRDTDLAAATRVEPKW